VPLELGSSLRGRLNIKFRFGEKSRGKFVDRWFRQVERLVSPQAHE
jgi:hypothetical protein